LYKIHVKINYLNIKAIYLLQIYTFKYNETRTKAALEEEDEEAGRSRDHRANSARVRPICNLISITIRQNSS